MIAALNETIHEMKAHFQMASPNDVVMMADSSTVRNKVLDHASSNGGWSEQFSRQTSY